VGKSTLAKSLASLYDLPVFDDPGRHGALTWLHPLTSRDLQVHGAQHALTVAALAPFLRAIVDRWVLSNVVYDGLRGRPVPWDFVREVVRLAGDARVFVLEAPEEVLAERAWRRGYVPTIPLLEQLNAFRDAAGMYRELGGEIHVIDANRSEEEVIHEVRTHW
jgi:thymidylate kinase